MIFYKYLNLFLFEKKLPLLNLKKYYPMSEKLLWQFK